MIKKIVFLFLFLFMAISLNASFQEGEKLFEDKCSSCHKEYISFEKLKENFFQRNNKLLNLTIPTVNMLSWAIMNSAKKIGDAEDFDMRKIEIEEYLKEYLSNPDINSSICDVNILKYYDKKDSIKISDEEAELLADYFMGYKKHKLNETLIKKKSLAQTPDEKKLLDKVKKEGKYLIVYASSQSCYFCKKMDKDVFSLEDIQKKIKENYIFLKIDVDSTILPFALKKHFKGMTPTFFILTSSGELLNTYPGAWVKSDFLEILNENL